MNRLRNLCATAVIGLILVVPAPAGTIHTGYTPPPPQPEEEQRVDPLTGEVLDTNAIVDGSTDPVTDLTLSVLQHLLTII